MMTSPDVAGRLQQSKSRIYDNNRKRDVVEEPSSTHTAAEDYMATHGGTTAATGSGQAVNDVSEALTCHVPRHITPSRTRKTKERLAKQPSSLYVNNLMWQVGLLELSNALDFPANIFNEIPTPLFAAVLMGIGGSIAILWSIFAFWDMHRSLRNIQLLRKERTFLKQWQSSMTEKEDLDTHCLVQAWLDVNFRELGWETIDRVVMDACCGISGVLVGTGAIMAIRGDMPDVFLASNLLSGYVGNSFLAPFALLNTIWAVFMWMRAGDERKLASNGKVQIDSRVQAQMRHHGRKHRLYAVLNGGTAIIGTVGSIMSATLWYGYVIVAPAVFTSLFSNLFWRYKMGYNRNTISSRQDFAGFDFSRTLAAVQAAIDAAAAGTLEKLPALGSAKSAEDVLEFIASMGLDGHLLAALAVQDQASPDREWLCQQDVADVVHAAKHVISVERKGILLDQERFLIEVYARYCVALDTAA